MPWKNLGKAFKNFLGKPKSWINFVGKSWTSFQNFSENLG